MLRQSNKKLFLEEKSLNSMYRDDLYAFVSKKIAVEGEKVGYMEREKAEEEFSGWIFHSGIEDEEYRTNQKNFEYLSLNYVCNCDPDIIPFLSSKEGARYCRDANGHFEDFNDLEIDTEELDTVSYLSNYNQKDIIEHIEKHIGAVSYILNENISDIISVDVLVVSPTIKRNYYTLVTMGMSAKRMQVPKNMQEYSIDRAELLMCVPANWRIDKLINKNVYQQHNSRWYWPISILRRIARLPFENQMCIGYGDCIPNGSPPKPFAAGTKLSGVVLDKPQFSDDFVKMYNRKQQSVNFYYANPVYAEEIEFRQRFNMEELVSMLRRIADFPILNVHRQNVCKKDWFS